MKILPALLPDEIIVDSFAGGGGASLGIYCAEGRAPDIAINHDREALAMHAANHPTTRHLPHNVWKVDPVAITGGAPVGLLWASPDCKHHSKAKGGKPVKRSIRDLAWVVVRWARQVRPRIVVVENVEEFRDWGPLGADERPCRQRKGETFQTFVAELRRLGYRVEHRELRACDYGAPTIRKRLFLVARRDGAPIVWPAPTHGAPSNPLVAAGKLAPWRTAAGIIDWSLPCRSIFLTREEARAVGVKRPLAENTMARIAKGVRRYVLDAAKPFIVPVTHAGDARVHGASEPLRTVTTAQRGEHALVTPFVTKFRSGATGQSVDDPLATVTANGFEVRPGGAAPLGIVAPHLVSVAHGDSGGRREYAALEPVGTQSASHTHAFVAPYLVPRYGERPARFHCSRCDITFNDEHAEGVGGLAPAECRSCGCEEDGVISCIAGQEPRTRAIDEPAPVVVPTANGGSLAAVHLETMRNADKPFSGAGEPTHTVTAGGARQSVVAAFLAQHNGDRAPKPGRSAEDPISTITAAGSNQAVCAAFLAQNNYQEPGHAATDPVSTIVGKGSQQAVVSAGLLGLKGEDRRGRGVDDPAATVCAGGTHAAEVRAFLVKYFGTAIGQDAADPLHTATAKPRFGVVTVDVAGEPYVVVDIGMRMLSPRELFRAQGFGDDYKIAVGRDIESGMPVPLTKTAQVRMCGNSVCPDVAAALVGANVGSRARALPLDPARVAALGHGPLFAGRLVDDALVLEPSA